jgi:tRNA(adenine34) deaminase
MKTGPIPSHAGLFANDPETIAESLASRETYPQGPVSGLRLLVFYLTYAGKGLSASRRRDLEKARQLLSAQIIRESRRAA